MAVPKLTHLMMTTMMMTMVQQAVSKMWMVNTSLLFTVMMRMRMVTKMHGLVMMIMKLVPLITILLMTTALLLFCRDGADDVDALPHDVDTIYPPVRTAMTTGDSSEGYGENYGTEWHC